MWYPRWTLADLFCARERTEHEQESGGKKKKENIKTQGWWYT